MRRRAIMIPTMMSGGAVDVTPPTVAITLSDETTPTYGTSVTATFTFSEAVTGFVVGDITVGGGGSLASFATADNITFTATWTFANGTNTLDIAAGVCKDASGNDNLAATQKVVTCITFVIRDDFTTDRAAGAINGTAAEPTGGTRTVIDTNSKITISSGRIAIATGPAVGDGLYYSSVARALGKALFSTFKYTSGSEPRWGFNASAAPGVVTGFGLNSNNVYLKEYGYAVFGASTADTDYQTCTILRATGALHFIKGGTQYTQWTLIYSSLVNATATLYPALYTNYTNPIGSWDTFRIPTSLISFSALASDAFTRADGAIGNTGGGGSEESGGSGLTWSTVGTWGVATNKAACSALSGGVGIATVNAENLNVQVECVCTRSGGNAGIILRYAGASDYIIVYHDGTNIKIDKSTTAGGVSNVQTTAIAYGATKRIVASLNATKLRVYYGDTLVGAEQTIADASLQTATVYGLYTTDTGATFDNFVVFARGNGGEYAVLDNYVNP